TRVSALSLTGKVINWIPFVQRYVQHERGQSSRWDYNGSVFDGFAVQQTDRVASPAVSLRVLVTLGANQHAGFERLVRHLVTLLPSNWEIFWQTGPTDVTDLDIVTHVAISSDEMTARMAWADVVIAHAGTGSALMALMSGKIPIVVPRGLGQGEHVDEHQKDLAAELTRLGLATVRRVETLTLEDIRSSVGQRAVLDASLPPLRFQSK
ncbi:glycosyltransferase, partial [Cryobacterium sp. MLB-32]|uniref:glycosyltransferase n=1 Tax=Cryobacterium sp. MLB-32 TaxID=1529318 RepID=UPI001E359C12